MTHDKQIDWRNTWPCFEEGCEWPAFWYIEYHKVDRPDGCDKKNECMTVCDTCFQKYAKQACRDAQRIQGPWWERQLRRITTNPPRCKCGLTIETCRDILQVARKLV